MSLPAGYLRAGDVALRRLGYVAEEHLPALYAGALALVAPSRYEGFGLPCLEAMACGTPVMVSQGAAVHEVLTDNEDAVIFPARNPQMMAAKIEFLMDHPRDRERIARAGLALVRTKYNWEEFARKVAAICSRLAAKEVAEACPDV